MGFFIKKKRKKEREMPWFLESIFKEKEISWGFILYSFWKHSTMEDILESKF